MSASMDKSSSPNSISDYASKPAESFSSPGEPPKYSPYLAPDPRTSSSQSLVSNVSDSDPRRTLILIYVHGFYGNDQSFQSFPYHVHSFLRTALAETHVIHSKIYPRYKTYRAIEIARDNFSQWLEPHESPTTDVILVGHSMGGILAADVVLMPNRNPYSHHPFKHRILGTIALDCPFLGLHPGIVVSGISSLFREAPEPPTAQDASSTTSQLQSPTGDGQATGPPWRQATADPLYDPPFFNDNPFREAPFVKRLMHFARKHKAEGIFNATAKHVLSHLEYGGCLADYPGLIARYSRIRQLEDVDELQALHNGQPLGDKARVRFVNYYTLSSGRKKPDSSSSRAPSQGLTPVTSTSAEGDSLISRETTQDTGTSLASLTASNVDIPVEDHGEDYSDLKDSKRTSLDQPANSSQPAQDADLILTGMDVLSMQELEPLPMVDDDQTFTKDPASDLPPIPNAPVRPPTPDLEQYTDKDARKQAEKEAKRVKKSYEQALKDHNKAIRERQKLLEKRRKKAQKDQEKIEKEEAKDYKQMQKLERDAPSIDREESTTSHADSLVEEARGPEAEKAKKNKKFCTLPRKVHGANDSAWVDIYMDGMDEVSAHCGLFFPGPHYDKLVGDVGSRIMGWVQDELTKRTILEIEQSQ